MFWLIMYDIANPKRLRKVELTIKSYGYRVQKSVFECELTDKMLRELKLSLQKIIERSEDSIRLYPLLNNSQQKQTILGCGHILKFETLLLA